MTGQEREELVNTWRQLDRFKADVRDRFTEIWGDPPDREELAWTTFHIWRLCLFYQNALDSEHARHESTEDAEHAPHTPPELRGERTERLRQMDDRLTEVLGDSVEIGEALDRSEDDTDEIDIDVYFAPPGDQILMVDYGAIIHTHAAFIDSVAWTCGSDGRSIQSAVMQDTLGFDSLTESMRKHVWQS